MAMTKEQKLEATRASARKSARKNAARKKAYAAAWQKRNAQRVNAASKACRMAKLEQKAGRPRPKVCEICHVPSLRELHWDHCHKTDEFRGWPCHHCNAAIAFARDNPETLRKLARYLVAANKRIAKKLKVA